MSHAKAEPVGHKITGLRATEVATSDFARFRRTTLGEGDLIVQSSPVPGGYLVTVLYTQET